MKKFASLVFVLCLSVSLSHADILRTQSGEVHNGQLTSYASGSFLFEVKEAKGIFLGRSFPQEEVAKIVMSSSEDFLFREYERLAADEILTGTTVETLVRPVDTLALTSGEVEAGRMKGFEENSFQFDISDSSEDINLQTVPANEVLSVTLSNAEYALSEQLEDLNRLLAARRSALERLTQIRTEKQKAKETQRKLAESVRTEHQGSIYDELDYEKFLRGNTFQVEILSETETQEIPYGAEDSMQPPFSGPSRDIEGLERVPDSEYREYRRSERDGGYNSRPLKRAPLRERRDESKAPRINYPFIKSVEVIGSGDNPIVLYHREDGTEEKP